MYSLGPPELALFGPAEVSKISGMLPGTVRTWRTRGFLESTGETVTRMTVFEVSALRIRRILLEYGFSPGRTRKIGGKAASIAFGFALLNVDGVCVVTGEEDAVKQFVLDFRSKPKIAQRLCGHAGFLAERVLRIRSDGTFVLVPDLSDRPTNIEDSCDVDLGEVGKAIGQLAERPLVRVSLKSQGRRPAASASRLITVRIRAPSGEANSDA